VKKVVLGMLVVTGLFAFSATAAQAGGAAGAGSFSTFFECHHIDLGQAVGEVVSTHEFDTDATTLNANVQIGKAVFVCRQVNVKDSAGAFINPNPSDQLKCYSVSNPPPPGGPQEQTLADAFVPSDKVRVFQRLNYLCGPTIPTIEP
jgi:hypothetical protein